jgi:hypothetical protein
MGANTNPKEFALSQLSRRAVKAGNTGPELSDIRPNVAENRQKKLPPVETVS